MYGMDGYALGKTSPTSSSYIMPLKPIPKLVLVTIADSAVIQSRYQCGNVGIYVFPSVLAMNLSANFGIWLESYSLT